MSAQRRWNDYLSEDEDDVDLQGNNHNISEDDDTEQEEQESDDDGSAYSSNSDKDEFVYVKMLDVRKEGQCPICLGIIRKTRKVMECLHRFCRECIDKSMRLGNNECPTCRAHCASRRSLRDDPNFDALIAVLYPDIDKHEAEELAFHEEEKARNKQTSRRQLEALGKKPATATAFMRRPQGNTHNLRGRKSQKSAKPQGSNNEVDGDNNDIGGKSLSSTDEPSTEVRAKRHKRWAGAQSSLPSSGANGGCDDNEAEATRKTAGVSVGLVGSSEIPAWGRGGMRSHTRHGIQSSSAGNNAMNSHVSKLIDHLQKLPRNDEKTSVLFKLVSLDDHNVPKVYLRCSPTMSTSSICEYVALENGLQANEIELLVVKGAHFEADHVADELQLLEEHHILSDVAKIAHNNLTLAYRKKAVA